MCFLTRWGILDNVFAMYMGLHFRWTWMKSTFQNVVKRKLKKHGLGFCIFKKIFFRFSSVVINEQLLRKIQNERYFFLGYTFIILQNIVILKVDYRNYFIHNSLIILMKGNLVILQIVTLIFFYWIRYVCDFRNVAHVDYI